MSAIIIPRRHYTQPQGRVQPAQEWSDGLLVLQTGQAFATGTGLGVGSVTDDPTPNGLGWSGGSGKYFYGPATHKPAPGAAFSVAFELVSRTVVDGGAVFSVADTATAGSARLLFRCSYPNKFDVYWGGSYRIQGGSPWVQNERALCVFSHDGTTGKLWVNGVLLGSATVAFNTESAATNWYFGSGYNTQFDATYLWQAQFSRGLDAEEALALYENPAQLFHADPIRIYSLPTGAIIPYISSVTMGNISQNSATTSIQLTF